MPVTVRKLTWDDIKDFPESHTRVELVDGELVMSPVASHEHQWICGLLGAYLIQWVRQRRLGKFFSHPVHVILDEHVHYEPDLCFIREERQHLLSEPAYVSGPPDLIIEVISESNRSHDTVVKFRDYERYGVEEYWIVDPRESHVRVFHLEAGRYHFVGAFTGGESVASRVFPELHLDPAEIFA